VRIRGLVPRWLRVAALLVSACSHEDELDELARQRELGALPQPPPPPAPCTLEMRDLASATLDLADDLDSQTAGVQLDITVVVGPTCSSGTLQYGMCQRDASNQTAEPAAWPSRMEVRPGQELRLRVTASDRAEAQRPCAKFDDKLVAREFARECQQPEVLCSSDQTCHADTQTNAERCGSTCAKCADGDHGTAVCKAGACELQCDEGYRFEAGQCRWRPGCKGQEAACGGRDCCEIDQIVADPGQTLTFVRGYDASNDVTSLPEAQPMNARSVTVDPFYMDRYEVTVGRFRNFVEAYEKWIAEDNPREGYGAHPRNPRSGWPSSWIMKPIITGYAEPIYLVPPSREALLANVTDSGCGANVTWTSDKGTNEGLPINCVNFFIAYLYCIWDGDSVRSRLPTEAEWMAAAGGAQQYRAYPWSDPPGNLEIEGRASYDNGDRLPFAAGFYASGAGRWKTLDLAGNLFEWVRDVAMSDFGPVRYVDQPSDPIDLNGDEDPGLRFRPLRGGSFKKFPCNGCQHQTRLRNIARVALRPWLRFNDTGIRCVRNY
jgi:sulfatase modifying factor 1